MSFAVDLQALRDGGLDFDTFATQHAGRFRRWAAHFFARWPQTALDLDDLVQEGLIEAWRAVDAWEPGRASLERFVEYRVGRKLRVELERVLGWPKKSRGQKPVRPLSMSVDGINRKVTRTMVDESLPAPERLELEDTLAALDDPLTREVVAGVGLGLSIRAIAARIYADPKRRLAYRLDSDDHALLRAHAAARKAIRQFVHPGGHPG